MMKDDLLQMKFLKFQLFMLKRKFDNVLNILNVSQNGSS